MEKTTRASSWLSLNKQDAANKKRKDFEASPAYKKRRAAANKKTSQANFEPAYEGADYSKEQIKGMSKKQRKDIE